MAWKIEYDRRVLKELKKLDKSVQIQILNYFDEKISNNKNPKDTGKPLKSNFSELWRYIIGNYLAIFQINDKKLTILVLRIAHRNNVYESNIKND